MAKRALDVVGAALLLLLLAPLVALVAAAVALGLGRPVLFRQVRPGLHAEPITVLKFRTMLPAAPGTSGSDDDERRLTPLGRLLRSTSLDELPGLWNVLRGNLSLVGPRPLLVEYLDLYSPRQARRHEVKPGLTGLAQVNGRNALSWEDKLELDVVYVEQQSLLLDLRILLRTPLEVVRARGISAEGHATAPNFTGTETALTATTTAP
jgi:lipopolysaccharide/colanic/teichoic acid biosynthesis glycosyltransferase